MKGEAIFSPCERFRYRLERRASAPGRTLGVIMVNPSTADAMQNDPTITKVEGFADRGGFGPVLIGNLFAFRSTDIKGLASIEDPRGPENDEHLRRIMDDADAVLFAWGPTAKVPRNFRGRWISVNQWARYREDGRQHTPLCLGVAKDGQPRHPLMVPYAQPMIPWTAPRP